MSCFLSRVFCVFMLRSSCCGQLGYWLSTLMYKNLIIIIIMLSSGIVGSSDQASDRSTCSAVFPHAEPVISKTNNRGITSFDPWKTFSTRMMESLSNNFKLANIGIIQRRMIRIRLKKVTFRIYVTKDSKNKSNNLIIENTSVLSKVT